MPFSLRGPVMPQATLPSGIGDDIDIVEAHDERIYALLVVENGDILTSEERVLGTYFHGQSCQRGRQLYTSVRYQ